MDFQGKVAIVTGAARGIGFACAEALLKRNAKVCVADILLDVGQESTQNLGEKYGTENICFVKCDVTSEKDFENAFITAKKVFGKVDILVNNAGYNDETNWELTVDINIKGTVRGFLLAQKHFENPKERLQGSVVNIASITGLKPNSFGPVYSATKHAIVGFTRSYGTELNYTRHNIKVHAICPGAVDTYMFNFAYERCLHSEMAQEVGKSLPKLSPDVIGEALIKVLQDGETGSCLIVCAGKSSKYAKFPNYD